MLVWCDIETSGLDASKDSVLEIAVIVTDDTLNEVARFERVIYSPKADRVLRAVGGRTAEEFRALPKRRNPGDKTAYPSQEDLLAGISIDPYVVAMHLENGLWEQVRYGQAIATVDAGLKAFLQEHAVKMTTAEDLERVSGIDEIFGKQLDDLGAKYGVKRADKLSRELTGIIPAINDDGSLTYEPDSRYRERIREAIRQTKTTVEKPQLAGSTISFDRAFLNAHFPLTTDEKNGVLHYRNCDVTTLNEVARRFWPAVHEARPGAKEKGSHRGMKDIELSIAVLKHYLANLGPRTTMSNEIYKIDVPEAA